MERKLYPCKSCGTLVPIRSKGLCGICRQKERSLSGELKIKSFPLKRSPIKVKPKKKKNMEFISCVKFFFNFHLENLEKKPFSQESGKYIDIPTTANIAHILPKRANGGFPSIACNLSNCIYLTLQEHADFDRLMDSREFDKVKDKFPNVWKILEIKIPMLLKICTERNKMYFDLLKHFNLED